ncbi:GDSL esterase/lipase At1g71250-like [Phoenix dactylifera]|uniref:GDSL esterase/lipase At1g71250-like n=1 Tax=Phoenix dactylifera TaxID=42345 RepID=A0A8B8J5H8_PHODC|nr:GDSL esterase/lipase At1g71250-like [Phoenix dactylifera]
MGRKLLLLALVFVLVFFGRIFPRETPGAAAAAEVAAADAASPATALFVLGDSSVNCGDNTFFYPLLPLNFSSTFCNGSHHRLLPDLIAERMGLPPVPPFYGLNGTAAAMMRGVNFGSTPATILSGVLAGWRAGYDRFIFQSLSQQVRHVFETLQVLQLELGASAARRAASSALFLLSFGKDDYAALFSRGSESDRLAPKYGRRGFARLLISRLIQAIKDLYDADVRRVAVMGVGPLGCAPRIVWEGTYGLDGRDCVEEVNEIVAEYNANLSARLLTLNSELAGAEIVFCDVYGGMMEIIANPLIYGFKNVRDACCGVGRFGGMIGCLAQEMACTEPSSHVWWDLYSTTESVNSLLANWSWSPSSESHVQLCKPIALQELASMSDSPA